MTEKPSYEELERQLAEAKKQLKKKSKNKQSYAQKHLKLWEKFFLGDAGLREFPRESRTKKTESPLQYFFVRGDKACFQYKTFILDLIEAYCLANDLPKQRQSMMRYEIKKALSVKGEKPGQTDKVKTKKKTKVPAEEKKISEETKPKPEVQSTLSGFVESAKPQPKKQSQPSKKDIGSMTPEEVDAGIAARKKEEAEAMARADARLDEIYGKDN